MADTTGKIDIDSTAKEIAKELLEQLKSTGIGVTKDTVQDDCNPSGVRFACDDKECDSNFTCHPAKKFECVTRFKG